MVLGQFSPRSMKRDDLQEQHSQQKNQILQGMFEVLLKGSMKSQHNTMERCAPLLVLKFGEIYLIPSMLQFLFLGQLTYFIVYQNLSRNVGDSV